MQYSSKNLTDAEKLRLTLIEKEKANLIKYQAGRELDLENLKAQRTSREALESSSSQSIVKTISREFPSEFTVNKNDFSTSVGPKTTYRDPARRLKLAPVHSCFIIGNSIRL